jgi:hypothetical protein
VAKAKLSTGTAKVDVGPFFVEDVIIHPILQAKVGEKKPEDLRLSSRPSNLAPSLQNHS